ncbi:hypothetical protein YC2023_010612 [Brassica napus]
MDLSQQNGADGGTTTTYLSVGMDSSQQNGADGGTTTTYTSVGSEESSLPHEILEDSNQTEAEERSQVTESREVRW